MYWSAVSQRQLWPSQIKKLVARAERSNEPSTTARQRQTTTTDTIEIPPTEILDRIFIQKKFRGLGKEQREFSAVIDLR